MLLPPGSLIAIVQRQEDLAIPSVPVPSPRLIGPAQHELGVGKSICAALTRVKTRNGLVLSSFLPKAVGSLRIGQRYRQTSGLHFPSSEAKSARSMTGRSSFQ